MVTYITDAEAAKTIRREIKAELGLNARQVSVRCHGGSISVTIKVPHAKKPIQAIAARQEIVRRCEYSGDILSGGNRFVSVSYGAGAFDEIIEAHGLVDVAERALAKPQYIVDIEGEGVGFSIGEDGSEYIWIEGDSCGHRLNNGWGTDDPRRIACHIAETLLDVDRSEPTTEAVEVDEVQDVELPAEIVDAKVDNTVEDLAAPIIPRIADGKIQPARIVFNWSESNAIGNGEAFETFSKANATIHSATGSAPGGGAYDKTDFTIHYTDGNTYHGRIDITQSMRSDLAPLTSHIRNFQRAMTGDHCPPHMDQKRYGQMIANAELSEPGTRQAARDFLARYALTDPTPTANEFESKQAVFMSYLGV